MLRNQDGYDDLTDGDWAMKEFVDKIRKGKGA